MSIPTTAEEILRTPQKLRQQIWFPCTCNCTSFVWRRDCHLSIYSTPIAGLELSLVSV